MKKLLLACMSLVLCFGLLSGCTKKDDPTTPPVNEGEEAESPEGETGEETEVPFTAYVSDADAMYLETKEMQAEADTAQAIVKALAEAGAIPEGSEVLSCDQEEKLLVLDMNKAFGEGMQKTGTTGEYLYMGSLVNTLLTHFDATSLLLTVEGKTLETGHSSYDQPLAFYEDPA